VDLMFSYNFPRQVTFTGFHIHPGEAGGSGPAVLGATLPANLQSDPSGAGTSDLYYKEIPLDTPLAVQTFENLFTNPAADYINAHTSVDTGGAIRAQLRPTDKMTFPLTMLSANEPGSPPVEATAPSVVTAFTLRYEDGPIQAGQVLFDVNYRFPEATNFTSMHIHDGKPGVNGNVTIPAPLPADQLASSDGFGNFMVWSAPIGGGAALATLTDMMQNPENHYLNLHTQVSTGGAVRAPIMPANTGAGTIDAVTAANNDKNATTIAPGELISITGKNLAKVGTNLDGWTGKIVPDQLNTVVVGVGTKLAKLILVSPTQIVAQVPFETAPGTVSVIVNNGNALSAPVNVKVAANAPAILISEGAAIIKKSSDSSVISASNPAVAGDQVIVYVTGLGQTTPALTTGAVVDEKTTASTTPVTATIGNQNANVVSSMAAPGLPGIYQVTLSVPSGVTGTQALVLKQAGVSSNSVNISVK
jgi:uncharacterized protein (TIGR03437 family)